MADLLLPLEGCAGCALDLDFYRTQRPLGVSFVVRVHNEAPTLSLCLASLAHMPFEHDVHVIFNGTTDGSREIAQEFVGDRVHLWEYPSEVSPQGLACYVTPPYSCHHLAWMNNWAIQRSRYSHSFRFDGDEIFPEPAKEVLANIVSQLITERPYIAWKFGKAYVHDPRIVTEDVYLFDNRCWAVCSYSIWELWDFHEGCAPQVAAQAWHIYYPKYQDMVPWFYRNTSSTAERCREEYVRLAQGCPHCMLVPRASLGTCADLIWKLPRTLVQYTELEQIAAANRKHWAECGYV